MKKVRLEMQPVFQAPYAALNPRMKVLEIVTEPLRFIHHTWNEDMQAMAAEGQSERALRNAAGKLLKRGGAG